MAGLPSSSLHPLTPPLKEEEWLSWLRLIRSRKVGTATFFRLLREHGSAEAALETLPELARNAGIEKYEPFSETAANKELRDGRASGAVLLAYGSDGYPESLYDIPDPPPLLWCIGDPTIIARPMIAMVGARNASSLGTRTARKMARDLGEAGYVVVSGLARGIDAASHSGALETGSVAVMAGGVDILYPAENAELAHNVAKTGLRVSEAPFGLQPRARNFPPRNRIISGLSRAVVVVEAASQSGSLITARNALDQGREVLAVPGHPFDGRAAGGNLLIRDGATLVRNAADVLESLPIAKTSRQPNETAPQLNLTLSETGGESTAPKPGSKTKNSESRDSRVRNLPAEDPAPKSARATSFNQNKQGDLAERILRQLSPSPIGEDQLIRDVGAGAGEVAGMLVRLELAGQIQRSVGGLLSLNVQAAD